MFQGASSFNQDISGWNTTNVTTMNYMFNGAVNFNQPLDNWDVSNVTNMRGMFQNAPMFDQPLNNWITGNVRYMESMFQSASSFNQPLNNWNTSNVTNMENMFDSATSFNQTSIGNWDFTNVTNMNNFLRNTAYTISQADTLLNLLSLNSTINNIYIPYFPIYSSNLPALLLLQNKGITTTIDILSVSNNTKIDLENAGYTMTDLKNLGCSAYQLKNLGCSAYELKNIGYTILELENAGYSQQEILDSTSTSYYSTEAALNQLKQAYNIYWEYSYNIALINLWYYTNTYNDDVLSCIMYIYSGRYLYYERDYIFFNKITGIYTITSNSFQATSTNNGLTPDDLSQLTLFYSGPIPPPPITCFNEGSLILTLNKFGKEQYIPIQNIRKGDLIKTLLNGYISVNMIGKSIINNPTHNKRIKDRLYILKPSNYTELFEDLIITGCHSILVDTITHTEWQKTIELIKNIYITDKKYRLIACIDNRSIPYDVSGNHTIYHLALENDDYYMNYGIYANGLLVETTSQRWLKELSNMELIE